MKATSKLGTSLTFLGALFIAAALLYSYKGLRSMEEDIEIKQLNLDRIETRIADLLTEIEYLKNAPLSELVKVDALAAKLDGRRDQFKRQLYDFSLWIDVPNNRKRDIREVRYQRLGGERLQDVLVGTEPSNGFGVNYLGWGCFFNVEVTILESNGQETAMRINQCSILNAGGMVWSE